MKIFNIGIPELIFLLLLGFLIMRPGEIIITAKKLGAGIRKIMNSSIWKDIVSTSNEIRDLPQKLLRETDLENEILEVKKFTSTNSILNDEMLEINKEIDGNLVDPDIKSRSENTR